MKSLAPYNACNATQWSYLSDRIPTPVLFFQSTMEGQITVYQHNSSSSDNVPPNNWDALWGIISDNLYFRVEKAREPGQPGSGLMGVLPLHVEEMLMYSPNSRIARPSGARRMATMSSVNVRSASGSLGANFESPEKGTARCEGSLEAALGKMFGILSSHLS